MKFKEIIFIILVLVSINVVSAMNISQGTIFHPSDTNAYYNVSSSFDNVNNITINSTSLIFDTDKGIMIFNNNPDVETYYDFSFFNITAKGVLTNVSIDNFSLNITYENDSWNFSTFDSWISVPLIHNYTYNITIDAPGYAFYNNSDDIIISGDTVTSFELYTTNAINFSFRNEETLELITSNVTTELISDSLSYNITTSNGTYYLDLITPEKYTIRYTADGGYDERFYYFDLLNRSYNELTLYLSNSSFTNVTATVYDQENTLLEGAEIRYLKYDIESNSYLVVGMVETNFEGEAVMPLVLNSEYYKFQIYYDEVLRTSTIPAYIYGSALTFRVVLTDLAGDKYFETLDTYGSVTYNDNTNNMKFDYSSGNGLSYEYCLNVYSVSSINGNTLINSSCVTGSGGTILLPVTPVNGTTYLGTGTVRIDGSTYVLDSSYKTFFASAGNKNLYLFFFLFLTLIFAFMGGVSLRASFILTPVPLFVGSILGVVPVSAGVTGGFCILGLILGMVIDK